MSITATLSIAAEALKAQQLAIQTTGHNLANVATPGFSRQQVNLVSAPPSLIGSTLVGQGVHVAGIQSVVQRFLESELVGLHGDVENTKAESQALGNIQDTFPTSGGIDDALSAFFSSLADLSNNPAGSAERVSVIGKAKALGDSLFQTRKILSTEQLNLDQDLKSAADRVNVIVQQVADLNRQITLNQLQGESANDFWDQRQTLLQELTGLTGATVRENTNGEVTVETNGLVLVSDVRFATLSTNLFNAAGFHTVTYQSPGGVSFDATSLFTQGRLGALLQVRDNQVQDALDRLDQFAKTLVDEVNLQHASGFDLSGTAGGDFFTPIAATAGAATQVQVDSGLAADPSLIAAAASADAVPGDNQNALALANLQSTGFASLSGQTLQDNFLSFVSDVGVQAQSSQAQLDFQNSLLTQTQARRESVSGVSIDEEMIKLIQFQRGFESASLLVRTADEMYQSLINMVQ